MMTSPAAPVLSVNVRGLLRQPGAHKHVRLGHVLEGVDTPMGSVRTTEPVVVDAEVESVVEGMLLTGHLVAPVRLSCVRCLREIDEVLEVAVQELFALNPRDAEEEGYAVLPDDQLPLDTMVRDAIVLSFPAAPLCRADCAGLCPVCGVDRNLEDCGHGERSIDPRWAPLLDSMPETEGPPRS